MRDKGAEHMSFQREQSNGTLLIWLKKFKKQTGLVWALWVCDGPTTGQMNGLYLKCNLMTVSRVTVSRTMKVCKDRWE